MGKRLAVSAVSLGLVASLLVAAPAAAVPTLASLTCTTHSAVDRDLVVDLAVDGLEEGQTTTAVISVSGGTAPVFEVVNVGSTYQRTFTEYIRSTSAKASLSVDVTVGGTTATCAPKWVAVVLGAPTTATVGTAGLTQTVSSEIAAIPEADTSDIVLEYQSGSTWKKLAQGTVNGDKVTFAAKVSRWQTVRAAWLDGDVHLVVSPTSVLDAKVSTPTIASKPTSLLQGTSAKIVVNYGSYATTGNASLQRKTSTGWVTISKGSIAHGTVTFSLKTSATYTFRVALKTTGGTTKYTPSFSVVYKPRLALSAPAKVKKYSTVTFTLTNYLAPPFYAYLQRWSGSKWVTVKTFVPGEGKSTVKAKVSSTSKWRVSTASYVSKTITVATY